MVVRGATDLLLEESLFDGARGATKILYSSEQRERALLERRRELLDVVAPRERIGGARHARLVCHHLLRAQRERRGVDRRKRERLVVAVGVQRLRAAEHRGERLHGDAHDIRERLLRGERHPAGLRVKAHATRRVRRTESIAHQPRVDAPPRAKLRDLLEQIAVRREEEGQPRREAVDREPGRERARDVLDRVRERERELLHRRRTGLAHVVARDRNRIP